MRVTRALHGTAIALVGLAACAPPPRVSTVPDPAGAHRFEIADVGDTTFRLVVAGTRWVRAGSIGIVVDPRRRDALVARFSIASRAADTATAVVNGQTARVSTTHVALLDAPPKRYSLRAAFWLGALAGGALGAMAALIAR